MQDEHDNEDEDEDEPPSFLSGVKKKKFHLHTHAPISNLIYHLGEKELVDGDGNLKKLTPRAAARWKALTSHKVKKVIEAKAPALKIRIPGGAITKAVATGHR
jgi:hypothetical protein